MIMVAQSEGVWLRTEMVDGLRALAAAFPDAGINRATWKRARGNNNHTARTTTNRGSGAIRAT